MTATLPERLILDRIDAPIGAFLIAVDEAGALRAVDFWDDEAGLRRLLERQYGGRRDDHAQKAVTREQQDRHHIEPVVPQ